MRSDNLYVESFVVAAVAIFLSSWFFLAVPAGALYGSAPDALSFLWIFERIRQNVIDHRALWDGGIFFPATNSLALSETTPGLALLYGLLRLFNSNMVSSFNGVIVIASCLNFLGFYALARQLFRSKIAALLGALFFTFSIVRICHVSYGHLHLLPQFPSVLAMLAWGKQRRLAAVLFAAQFYFSVTLGLVSMVLWGVLEATEFLKAKTQWKEVLYDALTLAILIAPLGFVYWSAHTAGEVLESKLYTATWYSYLLPPAEHFYSKFAASLDFELSQLYARHEKSLYLGVVPIVLALVALLKMGKREKALWIIPLLGMLLSFIPYSSLLTLNALRVPARFSFLVILGVALLAVRGFVLLEKGFSKPYSWVLAGVAAFLFLFEARYVLPRVAVPEPTPSSRILMTKPEGAVLYLPLSENPTLETERTFQSLYHKHSIGNGYCRTHPASYWQLKRELAMIQNQREALSIARNAGFAYAVLPSEVVVDLKPDQRLAYSLQP